MSAHHNSSHGSAHAKPKSGRDRHVPFIDHLQITRDSADGGQARVSVQLRPELLNNHGGGHGGVVMTLLDCAMAHAALSKVDYEREVVTVDMSVAFLRPATGQLVAVGQAVGGGKSVCFCEARITNADGEVAAQAMGTFRYRAIYHPG
jgi:uncharacterized protein (TIGR00369 family)